MKTFEVHITGEPTINDEFKKLGIKNIIVDLFGPNDTYLRTEYMSSFVTKHNTFEECKEYVESIINKLHSKIIRIKIETPLYYDYIERSLYIESHFMPCEEYKNYPKSINGYTGKSMFTDREYCKTKYTEFIKKWSHEEIELCLYDDFIREDFDWFKLYKK